MTEHSTTRGPTAGPVAGARRSLDRIILDAQAQFPGRVIALDIEPAPGESPNCRMFAGAISDPELRAAVLEWAALIDATVPKGPRRAVRS